MAGIYGVGKSDHVIPGEMHASNTRQTAQTIENMLEPFTVDPETEYITVHKPSFHMRQTTVKA